LTILALEARIGRLKDAKLDRSKKDRAEERRDAPSIKTDWPLLSHQSTHALHVADIETSVARLHLHLGLDGVKWVPDYGASRSVKEP